MIFWLWQLWYQISVFIRNWKMKKDSLQTVTVKGWSWKWNSSDYFFHSSKKYAVCFITGIIFLLSKLTSWLRKEPASFEFSLVQFCKELDIYTQCVCACVCVIYKNMYSLFSIYDQTFVTTEYKAKLQQCQRSCILSVVRSHVHYSQNPNTTLKI